MALCRSLQSRLRGLGLAQMPRAFVYNVAGEGDNANWRLAKMLVIWTVFMFAVAAGVVACAVIASYAADRFYPYVPINNERNCTIITCPDGPMISGPPGMPGPCGGRKTSSCD